MAVVGKCWPRSLLNIQFPSFFADWVDTVWFLWSECQGVALLGCALYAFDPLFLLVVPACLWISFFSDVMFLLFPPVPLFEACFLL
ncbi:hypothetical protein V6N11_073071 [Hibiscus sabdariffa]|uniref:Uncharacterized protein n=1 Tax=Hibiscus sabdariffa TaxID=183260 RepID=A0ABR2NX61_9ROSI